MMKPLVIPRDQHPISRKDLSPEVLKVLYRLVNHGYDAYLVGGCIRDLLNGLVPKDFDVATNATPQQIKKVFSNSRIIGRRFKLVHVYFRGRDIIEVATFRALPPDVDNMDTPDLVIKDSLIIFDNRFGSAEEDALRRDYTINALFYNIKDFSIIDYTGGMKDIQHRQVRCIGEPDVRFTEDPARMLRAIRFAALLDYRIEEHTFAAIERQRALISLTSRARLFEELNKFFTSGVVASSFRLFLETGILESFSRHFGVWYVHLSNKEDQEWVKRAMVHWDHLVAQGNPPSTALGLLLLFFPFYRWKGATEFTECDYVEGLLQAVRWHLKHIKDVIMFPQALALEMQSMVGSLPLFSKKRVGWANDLIRKRRWKEVYAFYSFHDTYYKHDLETVAWWKEMEPSLNAVPTKRRKKKTGRRRKPASRKRKPKEQ